MKRDSIFYRLFQQSPSLLFDLLENPPDNATEYRFDSVAVKEPKFEIDGVFLPPDTDSSGVIYFCEVQFQKDERLYERVFGESFLYFYRQREQFADWQIVVIYPTRSLEQSNTHPYRALLNCPQVHRIYLNELGKIQQLPLGVALMVLTTVEETQAPEAARYLLARTQQQIRDPEASRAIMEMIGTIMVYKFTNLSRQEVEAMLGIQLTDTRVYREAKEEGRLEGQLEGRLEGRLEGESALILRLLQRRFGGVDEVLAARIQALEIEQLESLAEALLDFTTLNDLVLWLNRYS
ncbi:Rpn family recombination-promoting nuclease/putative transposase [Microcystis sp.]|uniref:Rpn family recombination-promoting nuclease/putative transposase n=1 Tax=Microcystis sp. TaxID=1127 RepID=UPI00391C95CB